MIKVCLQVSCFLSFVYRCFIEYLLQWLTLLTLCKTLASCFSPTVNLSTWPRKRCVLAFIKHTARQLVCFQGKVARLGSHHDYGYPSDCLRLHRSVATLTLFLLLPMLSSHSCKSDPATQVDHVPACLNWSHVWADLHAVKGQNSWPAQAS